MLWLCLHFPLLPLEVFTRAQDDRAEQRAIAVVEKGVILRHNERAAEQGIRAGISASTARALSPELLLLERQVARESATLRNLADWAYRFTPALSLQPPHSLLLEIGASLRLFGGPVPLLRSAEADLIQRDHRYQAGIAPTPAGAFLLARALPCTHGTLPVHADTTSFRHTISRLSLAWLDCTEQQQRQMRQMGFSRIGDLLSLPRAALGKRFGKDFLIRLLQLSGEQPDPRPWHRPHAFFHVEQSFLEPVHDTAMLLFPMRRMLRELHQFLECRQCHCQRLSWRLRDQGGQRHTLHIPCSLQHNRHAALLELTRLHLQKLRLDEPVESVALLCRHYIQVRQQNTALFACEEEQDAEAERLLLDKLAIRLGKECIQGICLHDAHLPEQAWRAVEESGTTPRQHGPSSMEMKRPVWLLHQPQPIGSQRQHLFWNGHMEVLRGPERIENGWWEGLCARDYYIARHESGSLCWIFREHASEQWFLHGLFG